jgi:hypothetical protein
MEITHTTSLGKLQRTLHPIVQFEVVSDHMQYAAYFQFWVN